MALDHFVSQVHLRNFYALDHLLYAIRKSNFRRFRTKSKDVCRIEEGSTNAYLIHDRAIEDFLKTVEPCYNVSLAKLRENKMDPEAVASIAGFAAYVATCSPTAMRLHSGPIGAAVETVAAIADARGLLPPTPQALGGGSITDLIADGTVKVSVDPKYPQAIGISKVLEITSIFGNSPWEILHNSEADNPFFTSDYPIAIEAFDINTPINRIVPLAPDVAIRIRPDTRLSRMEPDFRFPNFRAAPRCLKRTEVLDINRLIVSCAEDLVFYRNDLAWIEGFVAKHRRDRIETITHRLPLGKGHALVVTQRIRVRDDSVDSASS